MDPITLGLLGLGIYFLFRSSPGSDDFIYRKRNGSWRAYFIGRPPSRNHVYHDNEGYYVCWDRPLRTEKEARQVAKKWMKLYS